MRQSQLFLKWHPNLILMFVGGEHCITFGEHLVIGLCSLCQKCLESSSHAALIHIRTLKLIISSVALKWTELAFNVQYLHNIGTINGSNFAHCDLSRLLVSMKSQLKHLSSKSTKKINVLGRHWGEKMVKETWIFFQRWRSGKAGRRSAWVDCLPGVRRLQGVLQTSLRNGGCQPFWTPVTKWSPRSPSPPIPQRLRPRLC